MREQGAEKKTMEHEHTKKEQGAQKKMLKD